MLLRKNQDPHFAHKRATTEVTPFRVAFEKTLANWRTQNCRSAKHVMELARVSIGKPEMAYQVGRLRGGKEGGAPKRVRIWIGKSELEGRGRAGRK